MGVNDDEEEGETDELTPSAYAGLNLEREICNSIKSVNLCKVFYF